MTRNSDLATDEGYFLAGRSLTGVFIAGSLLLTNLSTEQLVGLNGDSFNDGLSVMCWEVVAGASLVILALVSSRYLKSELQRFLSSWKLVMVALRAVLLRFSLSLTVDSPAFRVVSWSQWA